MRQALASMTLMLALLVSSSASAEWPFDRIVVFGDSLSDPGNAFAATGEVSARPYQPIPDAPYRVGRRHFSNGPTWVEQLAKDLKLQKSARAALARPGVYSNYAFGKARARSTGGFDLGAQVDQFLIDFEGEVSPDSLYVLFIGSNDLRDAFEALLAGNSSEFGAIHAAARIATQEAIEEPADAGARSFLVLNLPNIFETPALNTLDPAILGGLTGLLEVVITDLAKSLAEIRAQRPDITMAHLEVSDVLGALIDDPAAFGLANVTDSCITPDVIAHAVCRKPKSYLFWDFIHPTVTGHRLLKDAVLAELEDTFGR